MSSIRKTLNQLTILPSAARMVLIEVCELVENGGKGKCFAGNAHLAEKACCHPISVSKHLGLLKKSGLLLEHCPNGNPAARTLTPSPEVVDAYTSGDLSTLSRVLREGKQGTKATLSRVLSYPKQGTNHTHIHKEDTTILHGELATLRAAALELEGRLKKAADQYRADQQTIAELKAENETLKARSAPKPAKVDAIAEAAPDLAFVRYWDAYGKKVGSKSNSQRLWQKLAADTRRHILNGLAGYKAGVSELQYLPHPETFLNGRVWEAEAYGQPLKASKTVALPAHAKIGIAGRPASAMTTASFDALFAPTQSHEVQEPSAPYSQSPLRITA